MSNRPAIVRQSDLTRYLRAVIAAGVEVGRVEIAPDGTVHVIPANYAPPPKKNDWD